MILTVIACLLAFYIGYRRGASFRVVKMKAIVKYAQHKLDDQICRELFEERKGL